MLQQTLVSWRVDVNYIMGGHGKKWSLIFNGQLWGRHSDDNYVCIVFSYHYNNPLMEAL